MAMSAWRVMVFAGLNFPSAKPFTSPSSEAQSISPQNGWLVGTSGNGLVEHGGSAPRGEPARRYSMATTAWRVAVLPGWKVPSGKPLTMPSPAAQAMSRKKVWIRGTSENVTFDSRLVALRNGYVTQSSGTPRTSANWPLTTSLLITNSARGTVNALAST